MKNIFQRGLRCGVFAGIAIALAAAPGQSAKDVHQQVAKLVEAHSANWKQVSKQIWDFAELGYHEDKSSALLQSQLKEAGFAIKSGVADEPTAFVASYGEGKPVIGILGEFDALPGLSQQVAGGGERGDEHRAGWNGGGVEGTGANGD
jgi:aminobenzoyl-glutamate utilization protein B